MGRMQKNFVESKTYLQNNRTASEGYVGGQTFIWITETESIDNTEGKGYGLLEMILRNRRVPSGTHSGVRGQVAN